MPIIGKGVHIGQKNCSALGSKHNAQRFLTPSSTPTPPPPPPKMVPRYRGGKGVEIKKNPLGDSFVSHNDDFTRVFKHPISCFGVCYANEAQKGGVCVGGGGGCMAPVPALDLITSLRDDFGQNHAKL